MRSRSFLVELYLMGLLPASQVPDFFILRNQRSVGRSPEGQNVVAADKVAITIRGVIAHNGPRVPSFEHGLDRLLVHGDRRCRRDDDADNAHAVI